MTWSAQIVIREHLVGGRGLLLVLLTLLPGNVPERLRMDGLRQQDRG
jgi:hypothetical protein